MNPLLASGPVLAFDHIQPEHVLPAVQTLLAEAEATLERVRGAARTWEATAAPFESVGEALGRAFGAVSHLKDVAHTDALAAAFTEAVPPVVGFQSRLSVDASLFEALREFSQTDEGRALTGARRRWLDKTLDAFVRGGVNLPDAEKARLLAVDTELAELGTKFSQNVLAATAGFALDLDDDARLSGVPEGDRAMFAALAAAAGKTGFRLNLAAPVVVSILTHADDRALREAIWRAFNTRAASGDGANGPVIARMIELRRERAKILGFADFVDLVLADRMAKDGATARSFLAAIEDRVRPAFEAEDRQLRAWLAANGHPTELAPWDVGYYAEKQRKAAYDFDEEALRPYFRLDRVQDGLFLLANRLYGVTVAPAALPTWHKDAHGWSLSDAKGRIIGYFYTDFAPRPEKRDGAWMNPLVTGGPRADGGFDPHVAVIAANATPSVDGKPAFLLHREVETLFHEFGHLMHHLLSEVPVRSLGGTNVAWDFVELPSQILENWTWSREALDAFARDDAGAPIPADLFAKMTAARNYRAASFLVRQLGFGTVDLALHREYSPSDGDVVAYARAITRRYVPVPVPDDYAMITSFSHLFADAVGYAGGYYSYLWASVLEADAFSRFEAEGVFDAGVGAAFREHVLSRGDSEDPAALIRGFLGREPDPGALLRRMGL